MPRRKTRYYPGYAPTLLTSGPDWRWERAKYLVESDSYATLDRDGPEIVRAATYIRAKRREFSGRLDHQVLRDDPVLVEADAFRTRSYRGVLEVQMRILAGQGPKTIAAKVGMHDDVIRTYATLFFDVAGRLKQKTFICQRVIGLRPSVQATAEQLAMMGVYLRGSEAVDIWLDYLDHQYEIHDRDSPVGRQREALELKVAVKSVQVDPQSRMMLLKVTPILAENDNKMFRGKSVASVVRENVAQMTKEIAFNPSEMPSFQMPRQTAATGKTSQRQRGASDSQNSGFSTEKTERQPTHSQTSAKDADWERDFHSMGLLHTSREDVTWQ